MRRVLHLKMVTQCAMLEDFGIFLVLADKVCLSLRGSRNMLTFIHAVAFCLSYRGACSVIAAERSHVSNAPEIER